jgi:hypothetical protein
LRQPADRAYVRSWRCVEQVAAQLWLVKRDASNYGEVLSDDRTTFHFTADNIWVAILQAVQQLLRRFIEHTSKRPIELSAF